MHAWFPSWPSDSCYEWNQCYNYLFFIPNFLIPLRVLIMLIRNFGNHKVLKLTDVFYYHYFREVATFGGSLRSGGKKCTTYGLIHLCKIQTNVKTFTEFDPIEQISLSFAVINYSIYYLGYKRHL